MIEINQSNFGYAGPSERRCRMRSYPTAAHDDYKRRTELLKTLVSQKDPVARKLFENEVWTG